MHHDAAVSPQHSPLPPLLLLLMWLRLRPDMKSGGAAATTATATAAADGPLGSPHLAGSPAVVVVCYSLHDEQHTAFISCEHAWAPMGPHDAASCMAARLE